MQDKQASDLKAHLKTLHADLNTGGAEVDEELRSLLTELDADIRRLLERRAAAAEPASLETSQTYGMAERAQELTARFAAQHPRLEPALRELGILLSNLGI